MNPTVTHTRDQFIEAIADAVQDEVIHVEGTKFFFTAGPNISEMVLLESGEYSTKRSNKSVLISKVKRAPKKLWEK